SSYMSISLKQAQTQLQTAHESCEAKKNQYRKLALQEAEFIPFAIEAYGGLSASALNLINEISLFAPHDLSAWSKEIKENRNSAKACASKEVMLLQHYLDIRLLLLHDWCNCILLNLILFVSLFLVLVSLISNYS